jgi:HEAT repeat protein
VTLRSDKLHLHLLSDPDEEVREYLARRDDLSSKVLETLLEDPSPAVRQPLAYNKGDRTPTFVLEQLSGDPDEDVRWQVAYNNNTPDELLERIKEKDSSKRVRQTAAETLKREFR